MRRHCKTRRLNRGQAAAEYVMAGFVVVGMSSVLWLFYQGFVWTNLAGGAGHWLPTKDGGSNIQKEDKALGLEKTVALPFP